ncbi:hypothetical protein ACCI51_05785 [Microbulbifer echini]|uniref:Uncharacterized protein n=1 Tax=Microbulbifer echini TaxID=1529067 RepID=A0ABV4NL25_9GAMM
MSRCKEDSTINPIAGKAKNLLILPLSTWGKCTAERFGIPDF